MSDEIKPSDGTHGPRRSPARRQFLRRALGLGAAGAAALATLDRAPIALAGGTLNDTNILNFALNLEYLEGEYYTLAVTGGSLEMAGVATTGAGTVGALIVKNGNPQVPFQYPSIQTYANEIAVDEQKHVTFIRQTLGSLGVQPVARPAVDLLNSFQALLGAGFDPFANDINFLIGAYIFEDVGVSAYHGAAAALTSKAVLTAAAGILAVEAYHSGSIRTLLNGFNQAGVTDAISAARLNLGGGPDYGVDKGIVVADSNALATSRSPRQVLNIVYGGQNASAGLFFPNGLNGALSNG